MTAAPAHDRHRRRAPHPSPPWHYSGDLLTIEYRTDPARVRELPPEPLEPAEEDPASRSTAVCPSTTP